MTDRSQLPPAGAVRLASRRYFTTKASPKSAPRLRSSFLVSKSAKRLFQSVQKKQNPTTQYGRPCSGSSELKSCVDAAKRVSSTIPFAPFLREEKSSENQPSQSIRPARK